LGPAITALQASGLGSELPAPLRRALVKSESLVDNAYLSIQQISTVMIYDHPQQWLELIAEEQSLTDHRGQSLEEQSLAVGILATRTGGSRRHCS
jgi:hypothetical protein